MPWASGFGAPEADTETRRWSQETREEDPTEGTRKWGHEGT